METFLVVFLVFLICVAAMAVGVIVSGKRLSGSCGGRLPDGTLVGDCLCEKEKQAMCDNPKKLYQIELNQ